MRCRCGHQRELHSHYRPGTDCSQCGCPWFLWRRNPFLVRVWQLSWRREFTHMCPPVGVYLTPCCGKTPFELPKGDRLTLDADDVTCSGVELHLLS
jgi:hypothetical protein